MWKRTKFRVQRKVSPNKLKMKTEKEKKWRQVYCHNLFSSSFFRNTWPIHKIATTEVKSVTQGAWPTRLYGVRDKECKHDQHGPCAPIPSYNIQNEKINNLAV